MLKKPHTQSQSNSEKVFSFASSQLVQIPGVGCVCVWCVYRFRGGVCVRVCVVCLYRFRMCVCVSVQIQGVCVCGVCLCENWSVSPEHTRVWKT